MGTAIHRS